MDLNAYAAHALVESRLADLRADADRYHRARAAAPPRQPLRRALGHALIRMGQRLLGGFNPVRGVTTFYETH